MIFFCEDSDALLFGRVCIIAKIAVVVSVHLRKYKGEGGGGEFLATYLKRTLHHSSV